MIIQPATTLCDREILSLQLPGFIIQLQLSLYAVMILEIQMISMLVRELILDAMCTSDVVLEDEEIIDTPAPVEVAVSLPRQTTPVQSNAWIKPVNGSIVRAYNQGTILSNGIEITSPDSRVVAVQSGRVVYIGRDIIGYRNLILIEHLDNTILAYGFLNDINTSLGMSVNQGEEIGSAGLLSNRQRGIYFEIRRNGGSINPRQIISEL